MEKKKQEIIKRTSHYLCFITNNMVPRQMMISYAEIFGFRINRSAFCSWVICSRTPFFHRISVLVLSTPITCPQELRTQQKTGWWAAQCTRTSLQTHICPHVAIAFPSGNGVTLDEALELTPLFLALK